MCPKGILCASVKWMRLAQCRVHCCCEYCKEVTSFIKGGKFFDHLMDYQRHEKGCAPWSQLLVSSVCISTEI
jgi:hypothetical protein